MRHAFLERLSACIMCTTLHQAQHTLQDAKGAQHYTNKNSTAGRVIQQV
jgi:hypothetical protein